MCNYIVKGDPHNRLNQFSDEVSQFVKTDNIKFGICTGDLGFYPDLTLVPKIDPKTIEKARGSGHTLEEYDFERDYFSVPIYSVIGNHEDNEYLDDMCAAGMYTHKHLNFLHGAFQQIANNLFIFGFGKTDVQSTYENCTREEIAKYGHRNRRVDRKWIKRRNHFTREEFLFAIDNILAFNRKRDWDNDKILFVSHEAPRHLSPKLGITLGSERIGNLVNLVAPDRAYFGHYHYALQIDTISEILPIYQIRKDTI